MNWSSELPLDPGYYWVYYPGDGYEPEVVHVTSFDGSHLYVLSPRSGGSTLVSDFSGWCWAGPLKYPAIPDPNALPPEQRPLPRPEDYPPGTFPAPASYDVTSTPTVDFTTGNVTTEE